MRRLNGWHDWQWSPSAINGHEARPRYFSVCAMLMSQSPDGRPVPIRVHEVKGKTIVVDLNHPAAGKTLNFQELENHGVDLALNDPLVADKDLERFKVRVAANPFEGNEKYDAVILAVPHRIFRETAIEAYSKLLASGNGPAVFVDIKGVLGEMRHNKDLLYWSL